MRIEDVINQVYLINLDSRPDKLKTSIEMFDKLGITSYKRIVPNFDTFDNKLYLSKERQSVKDSHIRCVKDAIENNYTNILIFEDDFTFNQDDLKIEKNINHHIQKIVEFIKNNAFDFIYLDNIKVLFKNENNIVEKIERYSYTDDFVKIKGKAYTHSYILNKSIFNKFIDAQLKYKSGGNDGVSANLDCIKYIYSKGLFDQKLGIKADNKWS